MIERWISDAPSSAVRATITHVTVEVLEQVAALQRGRARATARRAVDRSAALPSVAYSLAIADRLDLRLLLRAVVVGRGRGIDEQAPMLSSSVAM